MTTSSFSGAFTALITPFRDGEIDEPALRSLVDFQIRHGITGLVPCGTTGESATMTIAEHNRVVDIVVDQAAGRVPVIAGTGSNDTRCAIEHTRHAARVRRRRGAGGRPLLQQADPGRPVSPLRRRSPRRPICRSSSTTCPAGPGSTWRRRPSSAWPSIPTIVGIKEASGSLDQVTPDRRRRPAGLRGALRRRLADAADHERRRPGRDLRRCQHRPGADGRPHRRRPPRRFPSTRGQSTSASSISAGRCSWTTTRPRSRRRRRCSVSAPANSGCR